MSVVSKSIKVATSALLLAGGVGLSKSANAQNIDPAGVTIIDASVNVGNYATLLADKGVTVVGRYFGRCPQSEKERLIGYDDKGGGAIKEISAIMAEPRMHVFSIYQFYSRDRKFEGGNRYEIPIREDDFYHCKKPDHPMTMIEEGQQDGYAALKQAGMVHQPPGSAIYFGVDYDVTLNDGTPKARKIRKNIIDYFTAINEELKDSGYDVGVYGNGAVIDLLLGEGAEKPLAKYAWLNASPAHAGSDFTYNDKKWDMLQTKADTALNFKSKDPLKPIKPLEMDGDMQNPASKYVGSWRWDLDPKDKQFYTVPHDRNEVIHDKRRFVCDIHTELKDKNGETVKDENDDDTIIEIGRVVRIFEENKAGTLYRVGTMENGEDIGWVNKNKVSVKRPICYDHKNNPKTTHCQLGSD